MENKDTLNKKLQRLKKFNDPVMLVMLFLSLPGVLLATLFSTYGDGTLVKGAIALCFLFFTWLAFKTSSMINHRIDTLQAQLKKLDSPH